MSLDFKEILETEIKKETKSKYRDTLNKFISSNLEAAKIVCDCSARAGTITHALKNWKRKDEEIIIFQRGNIVYLKKGRL